MSTPRRHRSGGTSLLRTVPAFRALCLARGVSVTGDGVARVGVLLLAAPHGAGAVAAVLLAATLPRLLGPLAGAVVDRVDQRRLMIGCDLGQLLAYAVLAATRPAPGVVVAVVAVGAGLATLSAPAGKTVVVAVVPPARRGEANAVLAGTATLQLVAGPALGGALVAGLGLRWTFAVDAASFLVSALLLRSLPRHRVPAAGASLVRTTAEGLQFVRRNRLVRSVVVGLLVFVAFASLDNVAVLYLVRDDLHATPTVYGVVLACFGVGLVAGSVVAARLDRRLGARGLLLVGLVAGVLGTLATGLAPLVAVAVGGQLVAGLGNALDEISSTTILQQSVPANLLGRVFGVLGTAAQAGTAMAYVAAPLLVGATGPRWTLVLAAGGMAGAALLVRTGTAGTPRDGQTTAPR